MKAEDVAKWLDEAQSDSEPNYRFTDAADAIRELIEDRDDLQRTFDMMWATQQRAIQAWQERHDKPLTWPDHAKLVEWLLEDRERLRAVLREAIEWNGEDDCGVPAVWLERARAALEPRK